MTLEELKSLLDEVCLDSYGTEGCYDIDMLPEEYELEVVEDGGWIQEGKYQYCTTIVKDGEGNFFCINNSRSGSYHSDWYYGEPYVSQVKKVEKVVTTTVWETV